LDYQTIMPPTSSKLVVLTAREIWHGCRKLQEVADIETPSNFFSSQNVTHIAALGE